MPQEKHLWEKLIILLTHQQPDQRTHGHSLDSPERHGSIGRIWKKNFTFNFNSKTGTDTVLVSVSLKKGNKNQ
jgi:hypothetical protein